MKRILLIIMLALILIPSVAAQNVTIKGVDFEIPSYYNGGVVKENSYVYESGFTFRILVLDDYANLKFNYGSDISDENMIDASQTTIAGHDAVVIRGQYQNKNYTTVYLPIGDKIFLICFNDTYVNDDIVKLIESAPAQTMSHEEFVGKLNSALTDYQSDLAHEEYEYDLKEQNKGNNKHNFFFFFWI